MAHHKQVTDFFLQHLAELHSGHLYKDERQIHSAQGPAITVEYPAGSELKEVLNFCANNYLGLSGHPAVIASAKRALDERGFGLSSVRFICGTQDIHRTLERTIADFLGMEDAILYSSCFDANGGVFEALLGEEDVIISDELNHASIIDGVRLCKAERRRFRHMDMRDLEEQLLQSQYKRFRLIVTDGAFSMDGYLADLPKICDLADRHRALVMVDDSHATGFIGRTGRGSHEHFGVMGRIDIISTTFGKALGGAAGGCISASQPIVEMLRQRSRPYLFSNTLSPMIVAATTTAISLLKGSTALRDTLERNTQYFRQKMKKSGFVINEGVHPIVPIILHEAKLVQAMARQLYDEGIYVVGFSYPVVPKGKARIRVQISAAHEQHHLDKAIAAFTKIGKRLGVVD
jgi:glycine C-acetyltransferase